MTRLAHFVVLVACASILLSCKTEQPYWSEDGSQKGRFSGSGGATLCSGYHAQISVVRGEALSPEGHVTADTPTQNLLYILTGFPNASLSSSGGEDAHFISTRSCTWSTPTNSITASLSWDRRTDVVSSGGRDYRRSKGDVFVFTQDASGRIVCRQLPTLGPTADCSAAVRHIRRYLAEDRFVASLLSEFDRR
jgi:hypothetical protein